MGHVIASVVPNDVHSCLSLTQISSTPCGRELYWSLVAVTSMFFHVLGFLITPVSSWMLLWQSKGLLSKRLRLNLVCPLSNLSRRFTRWAFIEILLPSF
jgi:hypothetical protein